MRSPRRLSFGSNRLKPPGRYQTGGSYSRWRSVLVGAWGVFAIGVLPVALPAQEPRITAVTPSALAPGAATPMIIQGARLDKPQGLWTTFTAEVSLADELMPQGPTADRVAYRVTVPQGTPCGIHGLRFRTELGLSLTQLMLIDDLPLQAVPDGNVTAAAAARVTVPAAVSGQVANLTTRHFQFTGRAGQMISVEVLARRLGSTLDPCLRLVDARQRELAFNDDAPGRAGDSLLRVTLPADGEYRVELRDMRYQGGAFYLRMGDFPCVTTPYPLAVQRGTAANITLNGPGTEGLSPQTVNVPVDYAADWLALSATRPGQVGSGFAQVAVTAHPQLLEQEPNNVRTEATPLETGAEPTFDLNGRFDRPGDVDHFAFTAKKGESLQFVAVTRQVGSPADLQLQILNADGAILVSADDAGTADAILGWQAPADGQFTLVVQELNRRGGPEFVYQLQCRRQPLGFQLFLQQDTVNLPAGGSAALLVSANRTGHGGEIELTAGPLPPGVVCSNSVLGANRNQAVLTLTTTPEFPGGLLPGLTVRGAAQVGEQLLTAIAETTPAYKSRLPGLRSIPNNLLHEVGAASVPPTGFTLHGSIGELTFGKDLAMTMKFRAERMPGFDGPITLAVYPPQDGLPGGVGATLKNIDAGQSEVDITFSANNGAAFGDFTAVIQGTSKIGELPITQVASAIRLKLRPGLAAAQLDLQNSKFARGTEATVRVTIQRNPAFGSPVKLKFNNLPAGVTAPETVVPELMSTVEVKLAVAADAPVATASQVTVTADGMTGNTPHQATSPPVTIAVE